MPIRTTDSGKNIPLVPAGMQIGRCVWVIDLGTHTDQHFGKSKHLVLIGWELPELQRSDGNGPQMIFKRYTLSHNAKANLRADLESWYGRQFDDRQLEESGGFDLEKLLGRTCFLNVVHSQDGKYANVAALTPLPKQLSCAAAHNELVAFSLTPWDQEAYDELPPWLQTTIGKSDEYVAMVEAAQSTQRNRSTLGMSPEEMGRHHDRQRGGGDDDPFGDAPPARGSHPNAPPSSGGSDFDRFEDDIPF